MKIGNLVTIGKKKSEQNWQNYLVNHIKIWYIFISVHMTAFRWGESIKK